MKRVKYEPDYLGGYRPIPLSFMADESLEMVGNLDKFGEVPDDVWARYQAAETELCAAFVAVSEALQPLNISEDEKAAANEAWQKEQAEEQALYERLKTEHETCQHRDGYGSTFIDGSCMLCGAYWP